MIKVQPFSFPSFSDWVQSRKEWKGKVGAHWCKIAAFSWSDKEVKYTCSISTHDNPSNLYAVNEFRNSFRCKWGQEAELEEWYNKVTKEANEKWAEYIQENYLAK